MIRAHVLSLLLMISIASASAEPADQTSAREGDVVQASTLKRTYTVTPTWPESASGVEGWVRLHFTVLPDGTVSDVVVKESDPANVFDASAMQALQQWKFEPVERAGKKIAQRAEIRMKFALPR